MRCSLKLWFIHVQSHISFLLSPKWRFREHFNSYKKLERRELYQSSSTQTHHKLFKLLLSCEQGLWFLRSHFVFLILYFILLATSQRAFHWHRFILLFFPWKKVDSWWFLELQVVLKDPFFYCYCQGTYFYWWFFQWGLIWCQVIVPVWFERCCKAWIPYLPMISVSR